MFDFLQALDKDDTAQTLIIGTEHNLLVQHLNSSKIAKLNTPQMRKRHYSEQILILQHLAGVTGKGRIDITLQLN